MDVDDAVLASLGEASWWRVTPVHEAHRSPSPQRLSTSEEEDDGILTPIVVHNKDVEDSTNELWQARLREPHVEHSGMSLSDRTGRQGDASERLHKDGALRAAQRRMREIEAEAHRTALEDAMCTFRPSTNGTATPPRHRHNGSPSAVATPYATPIARPTTPSTAARGATAALTTGGSGSSRRHASPQQQRCESLYQRHAASMCKRTVARWEADNIQRGQTQPRVTAKAQSVREQQRQQQQHPPHTSTGRSPPAGVAALTHAWEERRVLKLAHRREEAVREAAAASPGTPRLCPRSRDMDATVLHESWDADCSGSTEACSRRSTNRCERLYAQATALQRRKEAAANHAVDASVVESDVRLHASRLRAGGSSPLRSGSPRTMLDLNAPVNVHQRLYQQAATEHYDAQWRDAVGDRRSSPMLRNQHSRHARSQQPLANHDVATRSKSPDIEVVIYEL